MNDLLKQPDILCYQYCLDTTFDIFGGEWIYQAQGELRPIGWTPQEIYFFNTENIKMLI